MNRIPRILRALGLAGLAVLAGIIGRADALQWDVSAGDFHTHLVSTEAGFQLHVHDKATHRVVDTRQGKVTATMLVAGKPQPVSLTFVQAGVLAGARPLVGDWTLLVRFDVPGMKPAQVRYSSKMKAGSQDAAPAARKTAPQAGHDHAGHDHAPGK
jgi:hypothetical protein